MGAQWKAKGKELAANARGRIFGKLSKDIMLAARSGADPAGNARLRLLVLDVDGVLTDGSIVYGEDGEELKRFSILDGLGIKAEAALVSSSDGDGLDKRLPMPAAFDHVIVRATIAGHALELTPREWLLLDLLLTQIESAQET